MDPVTTPSGTVSESSGVGVVPLANSVDLYQRLIESVTDHAIFALDATGRIITWNVGARRLKGYSAEEIIGRHFSTFYSATDLAAERPRRALELAARDGRYEDEGWRIRKDGSRFWASVVISAVRDDAVVRGFVKVTRDLTARREMEEALRRSEQSFRLLVDAVEDYAILTLDPHGVVTTWNEGARRIKGYTAAEIVGRHISTFYPQEAVAAAFPAYELEVAAREGRFEDEGWRVRKDGSRFWANVIISAMRDVRGELVGFAKITRDLTARRDAEEQARRLAAEQAALAEANRFTEALREALQRAEAARDAAERAAAAEAEAYRSLDQFAYVASHDLKAPLRGIGNLAQWIQEDVGDRLGEEATENLRLLQGRVQRMTALIDGILAYSRAGRVRTAPEQVDTGALVREVIGLLAPAPTVTIDVAAKMPWLQAERVPLQQVFLNLLGNAIKYSSAARPDVEIAIGWRDVGDAIEFEVKDNGPGIDPRFHERIFLIFQTLAARDKVEGTGIGLSVVRKIVEARGGRVRVESAPEAGATFRFTWPKTTQTEEPRS
jgi:PAS domain S-box-containing protein